MKLRTYHAYSMAEALAAVKQDLGADAVILHTRTFKRGGIMGWGRRTIVEVTATPGASAQIAKSKTPPRKPQLRAVQAQRAYASALPSDPPAAATNTSSSSVSQGDDQQRTRRLAMAMVEAHNRKSAEPMREAASAPIENQEIRMPIPAPAVTTAPMERAAKRFILASPEVPRAASAIAAHPSNIAISAKATGAAPSSVPVADELSAIRQMVGQVLQRQMTTGPASESMPRQLFDLYLKLVAQDISEELSNQIVNDVRAELSEAMLEDAAAVRTAVMKHLASFIPVGGDSLHVATDGRPLTIALVGPTGVGKTTTLAKLAATFKLRHGKSVGLVTADTYRIAAVDQLRTYADIINLPLQVALTPSEMKRAVQSYRDKDVILIDTAGRSQRDSDRLSELKRFITAGDPHEVHLVLSGTAGEKVLLQEAQAFSQVGVHKVVLTKLDEAVSFGMLVNVIRQIGKELSFVTTGQEVPDDLEVGRADRLAELVLGGPVHHELAAR